MEHEADVRPVDPHPEGDGGDDDVDRLAGERLLRAAPLRLVEPGMVGPGEETGGGEPRGEPLGLGA